MLVLSRREGETLVLPDLDVVLEVLAIKGNTTRLGVRAPSCITVLRGELAESRRKLAAMIDGRPGDAAGRLTHRIRNWLHLANLRMQLIRRHLEADRLDAAAKLIQAVLDDFRMIESAQPQSVATSASADSHGFGGPSNPPGVAAHRALLVEDNANERQLLAGFLRTCGFQVETAGDGAAALDYLSSHDRPDLVLLDMLMPRCDGPTILRTIRENPCFDDLKVFAVSGTAPTNWDIPIGPEGVDRWFQKPVDPQALVREISRELGRREVAKPR
jgi:carbon storage regulator CsrA